MYLQNAITSAKQKARTQRPEAIVDMHPMHTNLHREKEN